ncbi:MAG TPA: hypothetical protein VMW33_10045 [Ilumatobacteraceae bacterium]|nr:hypothetical protein [Ilumatobacteraceae bacterium]
MNHAEPSLVDKVVAVDRSLTAAGVRYAFGGALALAYYTLEPRATADIDVNVTVDATDAERIFRALPDGVAWTDVDLTRALDDEQVRLWWGRTPVDLFFRASEFHDAAADRVEMHPFGTHTLPFLSAQDLVVFKSLFDRPKDWVDISAMHAAGAFDVVVAVGVLRSLIGDDPRVDQLARVASNDASPP